MNIENINKSLARSSYSVDAEGNLLVNGKDDEKIQVSNFVYQIKEIIEIDDGQEVLKYAVCIGLLKGNVELSATQISFDKLSSTNWPLTQWGIKCIVNPRQSNLSYLFHVAQLLSMEAIEKTIYAHIGWQKIADKYVYLHCGGAIGSENVTVQIDENLSRYRFPKQVKNPEKALRSVLELHKIASEETIVPLIAYVFLAPLVDLFKQGGRLPNFLVLLYGLTGTRKTSLALILLSFFGDFGTTSPPASFKDTANAVELKSFQTKDSVLLVDDYHPQQSSAESRSMQQLFQKLLRSTGDRIGRGRMGSDLKMRKSYAPRGMILVTGEDLPKGHSSAARYLGIEVEKDEINLKLLSDYQNNSNLLNSAMATFIGWIQPQYEEIADYINNQFPEVRNMYVNDSNHGRTAEAVAYLHVAYELMINWIAKTGVLNETEASKMLRTARKVFTKLVLDQNAISKEQTPVEIFVSNIAEMINRGKITLTDKDQALGTRSSTTAIGWQNEKYWYLLPEATYNALAHQLGLRGEVIPVSATMLWKQMASAGLLVTETEGDRLRTTIKVALKDSIGVKKRIRVLKIRRSAFEKFVEE